jgi:hypothetical protein
MMGVKAIPAILLPLTLATARAEISDAEFDHLFTLCQPSPEGTEWLELGWETDLWKARQRAAQEGKPIFLWEMDGHPLGCT